MNHTLQIGQSITIKRTDGRLQTAIISSIDPTLNCVKVEWLEDGETKGKEVHVNNVLSLNPISVRTPRLTPYSNPQNFQLQNSVSQATNNDFFVNKDRRRTTNATTSFPITSSNKIQSARSPPTSFSYHRSSNNLTSADDNKMEVYTDRSRSELGIAPKPVYSARVSKSTLGNIPDEQPTVTCCYKEPPPTSTTIRKLSKLERDRAQRRARQAELKAEKEQIMRKSQNTPHWQLFKMIDEYRSNVEFAPLSSTDVVEEHLITVAVRKRPLNASEVSRKEIDIITVPMRTTLIVHEPKLKVDLTKYLDNHCFKFDYALNEHATNELVFKYTAQPLIKTVFQGGFATCFAYGQTGSGKTYTMSGDTRPHGERGIYALTASDMFRLANSNPYKKSHYVISCSFFEIYVKKVFDLLNKRSALKILEDGKQQIQVVGLTETVVRCEDEVLELIKRGNEERASGQTSANSESSRSHAIFQFYLRNPQSMRKIHGKFSLIDLAGNERGADTYSSSKLTRLEGAEINQSLLSLKECIRALGRKGAHLPFRGSKLTQVLKDSFVGNNSKTCMIAMVSPGVNSCENTLNTLRYADRVKELGSGEGALNKSDVEVRSMENDTNCTNDKNVSGHKSSLHRTQGSQQLKNEVKMKGGGESSRVQHNEKRIKQHKEVIWKLQKSVNEAEELLSMIGKCDEHKYLTDFKSFLDDTVNDLLKAKDIL